MKLYENPGSRKTSSLDGLSKIYSIITISPPLLPRLQALGYTESDSAGQTNIFAVEPRSYVAGSTRDQTKDAGNSTTGAAAIAGTVAVGAFIAGLILLNESSKTDLGPTGEFLTLSQYKAQFASESSAARPAPVSAPEVVEEN